MTAGSLGHTYSSVLAAPFVERRRALFIVIGMSAALNVLMLSGALFMLLVYDEILPSRSVASLAGLLLIVTIAYLFQGAIEHLRNRIMLHVGNAFQTSMASHIFGAVLDGEMGGNARRSGTQPVRDMDQLRSFIASPAPMALLDLPWVVLFLGMLFVFHVLLGTVTLFGALFLLALALLTDRMTRVSVQTTTNISTERSAFAEASRRNAEVIRALGMRGQSTRGWSKLSDMHLAANSRVTSAIGAMGTSSKTFRMFLQSLVLACGAWLVINDRASGGVIIASSILAARALAPIDQAIANWRGFIAARQAWVRLVQLLGEIPPAAPRTALPVPSHTLVVEGLAAAVIGTGQIVFRDVNLKLQARDTLAIIGPSGSGKSSLARAIVGVWPPLRGSVRLDGAALDQWHPDVLGRHIGYLPQNIELIDGTIAQNIARFAEDAASDEILKAAGEAGVHDMIVRMPQGYDTHVGPGGRGLSAGQTQRIALARALFREPFLIVLDEPNSNLDAEGDAALNGAIRKARDRGAIVIIVAHRPSALAEIEHLLLLDAGQVRGLGAKAQMLPRLIGSGTNRDTTSAALLDTGVN